MPNTTKTTHKKVKKRRFRFAKLFMVLAIFISCVLMFLAYEEVKVTLTLKKEISISESENLSLKEEKKDLEKKKKNLENPEYVARYARGKYMVSKPGEQIFKLPAKSNDGKQHDD